jgi:hypothetical protein
MMEHAKKLFEVNSVFPFVNYTTPVVGIHNKKLRDDHIDFIGLTILKEATSKAQENILYSQSILKIKNGKNMEPEEKVEYNGGNEEDEIAIDDEKDQQQKGGNQDKSNNPQEFEILVRLPQITEQDKRNETIQRYVNPNLLKKANLDLNNGTRLVTQINYDPKDSLPVLRREINQNLLKEVQNDENQEYDLLVFSNSLDEPIGVVPRVNFKKPLSWLRWQIIGNVECKKNFYFADKATWNIGQQTPSELKLYSDRDVIEEQTLVKENVNITEEWNKGRHYTIIYFDDLEVIVQSLSNFHRSNS